MTANLLDVTARLRAIRRLDAMRPDSGIVSLTPSMLRDVFGL